MKRENIVNALSGIEDKFIAEAAEGPSAGTIPILCAGKKWLPTAACIVLVAGIGLSLLNGPTKGNNEGAPPSAGMEEPDSSATGSDAAEPELTVKLLSTEGSSLRAVVLGGAESKLFPVGTEVTIETDADTRIFWNGQDRAPEYVGALNAGTELEVQYDHWGQEEKRITLYAEKLFVSD